jgi:hypothetical protein
MAVDMSKANGDISPGAAALLFGLDAPVHALGCFDG